MMRKKEESEKEKFSKQLQRRGRWGIPPAPLHPWIFKIIIKGCFLTSYGPFAVDVSLQQPQQVLCKTTIVIQGTSQGDPNHQSPKFLDMSSSGPAPKFPPHKNSRIRKVPRKQKNIYIYIYICCEVIIWAKFGHFRCYYLGQVGVIIWAKLFLAYKNSGFKRFFAHTVII